MNGRNHIVGAVRNSRGRLCSIGITAAFAIAFTRTVPASAQETAGQAEIAIQGYYLSGSGQPFVQTSGIANNTTQFIDGVGLLKINLEGYGGNGFRTGNIFVGLEGAPMLGWHWDFIGGDFHFASNIVENPFSNVYTPEIAGRGGEIAMRRTGRTYRFFLGEDTVLEGPRIPFRMILPQRVIGATVQQKIGEQLELGVRFLNLATNPDALAEDPTYFFPGRSFRGADTITFQSSFRFNDHFKLFGEAGYGRASGFSPLAGSRRPFSVLVGPSLETKNLTLRANYVQQGAAYMPLLGYFAGDRKGPYVEGHYRPLARVEFYGSASAYSNNLEQNPNVPSFSSSGYTVGASATLPYRFSAGASLTSLHLTERDPSRPVTNPSDNQQTNLNLSRPLGRHSLRFSLIDMKLNTNATPQSQRFEEFEDTFTWKRFVIGGATRFQNSQSSSENRNTLFLRGSLQASIKRISAYGYMEKGNDLVNKSIFSTNSVKSTVAGLSAPLFGGWTLQFEAFQNQLLTALNPENIFLFGNSDQGLNTQLAGFNQRSIYVRIGRKYMWGAAIAQGGTIEQFAAVHAPLTGSVEGIVKEVLAGTSNPAANVSIILDHNRKVTTDDTGHYAFADVPEGLHEIALNMEELPADLAPGEMNTTRVSVTPRAVIRSDFDVARLATITGKVTAPKELQLDGVVIRIVGSKLYTTPYDDGTFTFYNLRQGEYQVELDANTIPDGYVLNSPGTVTVAPAGNSGVPQAEFEIKLKPQAEKPVREMLKQQIHVRAQGSGNN